jgi:hypothetical protein
LKRVAPAIRNGRTIFFTCRTAKFTTAPFSPIMSPSDATTTCFTCVFGNASCATAAKFSSTISASAPASASCDSSSRAV